MSSWIEARWAGEDGSRWNPGAVRALTTIRVGGVSAGPYASLNLGDHVGDDPAAVADNRRRLADAAGCPRIQWLSQVHGTRCIHSTGDGWRSVPEADAAWTREPDLALAVLTADCVPVVLRDRAGTVVGVAHGGWRGLVSGVIGALVAQLPVAPEDMLAWLGPAIGPQAYEVGSDVAESVRAGLPEDDLDSVLLPGAVVGKWQLDLFALAEKLLLSCGVGAVSSDRLCTFSDDRFYSYRRDGVTGRMATLAWLPGQASAASQLTATPC